LRSVDPNNIEGPSGYGPQGFVQPELFSYGIEFQNKPTATAPAQVVVVTQQIDPNLDWSTFQLGNIAFGDTVIDVPAGQTSYSTQVDLTATLGIDVDVAAIFNTVTGLATWTFTSIDPTTLDVPSDPLMGFLPLDKVAGEGEGFVNYSIMPKAGAKTGTAINARATVVFDANAPLSTADFLNTLDVGPPTSSVAPLPANSPPTFTVSWSGTDNPGGSGVASYNVYVSDDGGAFTPFATDTIATSASFTGQIGHTYGFYGVATDHVGNVQATPTAAQTTTTVVAPSVATTTSVTSSENPAPPGVSVTFTATVAATRSGSGTPTGTVQFQVDGTDAGSPIALVNGGASYTSPALSPGDHTVTATFTSNAGLFASSSGTLAGGQSITEAPGSISTTTALSANVSSAVFGQAVTFTAIVSAQAAGSPSPTGSVSFLDGSTVLGGATLNGGEAQFTTTSLGLGSHSIQAVFGANGVDKGSQSAAADLSVRPDGSAIVVTPSADPSPPGRPVTLTAVVSSAAPGGGIPTGTVTYYNGKKALGTVTLNGGVATLTTKKLTLGTHAITVIYHGDSDFEGVTSGTLREVIKKPAKRRNSKAHTRLAARADQEITAPTPRVADDLVRSMSLRDRALEAINDDWPTSARVGRLL
jgi:hypothetical protein